MAGFPDRDGQKVADIKSWLRQWLLKLDKGSMEGVMVDRTLLMIEELVAFRRDYEPALLRKQEIIDELRGQMQEIKHSFNYPYLDGDRQPSGQPAGEAMIPKIVSGSSAESHENKGERMRENTPPDGMRTERVALEVTLIALVTERDAALARVAELEAAAKLAPDANVGEGSNQPRGWLTEEERAVLQKLLRRVRHDYSLRVSDGVDVAVVLDGILARNSPPEVVLADFPPNTTRNLNALYVTGWIECMARARQAIAAAGVKVKEVGSE